MIDIVKAKKAFKEYVKKYDYKNEKIQLKISHIERTSKVAKATAEYLNLDEENIRLAELIGLLHDIGRFEQIKRYNTFIDKDSIDHGKFGADLLFEEGLIRKFIEDDKYDNIIKKAILNHNRDKENIDKDLTEEELLHTKIIRDSDKVDIYNVIMTQSTEATYGKADISDEKITDAIYNKFIEEHKIDYKDITSHIDVLAAHFAYAFDFNFNFGIKIISEKNYINRIVEKFDFKNEETLKRVMKMRDITNEYINNKLKGMN